MTPDIHILIIGAEILGGRVADTNTPFLRDRLASAGYAVRGMTVAGDDVAELARLFRELTRHADILLATGGLGPTSDDVTVEALARAIGRELIEDRAVLAHIEDLFRRRGRTMTPANRKQALIPEGAEVLSNPDGTAPGILLETPGTRGERVAAVVLMPGVPQEMRAMFENEVLPRIRGRFTPETVETAVLKMVGMPESEVYETIRDLPGAREAFSYYPGPEGIEVRILTQPGAPAGAAELRDLAAARLGDAVYAVADEPLEEVVARLLIERNLTVAVAESCTGGLVASRLTDVPGSSAYFLAGITAYANDAKERLIGVDPALIARHGAVSAEVAAAMADGVRKVAGADIGLATTGIAGPGGGTPHKPVGLMFAGIADAGGVRTNRLQFGVDRHINKRRMTQAVLDLLRRAVRQPVPG